MITGKIESIFISELNGAPTAPIETVEAIPGKGLVGDRHFKDDVPGYNRQITLIEKESIDALEDEYGIILDPGQTRRNLVTTGIALNLLVGKRFKIGELYFEGTDLCEPCKHLASMTDPAVLTGLVHRGGLCARILSPGIIHKGDLIQHNDSME